MSGWIELLLRNPEAPPLRGCDDIIISTTPSLSDYESAAGKLPMAEFNCVMDVVCMFLQPDALIRRPLAPGDIINMCFVSPKQGTVGLLLTKRSDLWKFVDGRFNYDTDKRTNLILVELKLSIPSLAI